MRNVRLIVMGLMLGSTADAQSQEYECLLAPWKTVEIGTPAAGLLDELHVTRGDFVKRGQVIARLDAEIETATAELARTRARNASAIALTEARLAYEEANLERRRELHERGVLPDQDLYETEATTEIARLRVAEAHEERRVAEMEAARAEAILTRRTITSPIDGVVVATGSQPGEYLSQTDPVVTVAMTDPIQVDAFLPLEVLGRIAPGDRLTVFPQDPIGGRFDATLDVIDGIVDARSGTVSIRARLENPERKTLAGLNCRLQFVRDGG